jgi:hypothetical protein
LAILFGSNCAPVLHDLILYSNEADFIQGLIKNNKELPESKHQSVDGFP